MNEIPKSKQKCYNCKHAERQFKINNKTHLHCGHPKWEDKYKQAPEDFSAWDTLREWWDSCSDFEAKQV